MKFVRLLFVIPLLLFAAPAESGSIGKILYFSSEYCIYCKVFDREVYGIYARTDTGKILPMVKVDTFDPQEEYEEIADNVLLTPCFRVYDVAGREVSRIRGYRGEEFWWGELKEIITKMQTEAVR